MTWADLSTITTRRMEPNDNLIGKTKAMGVDYGLVRTGVAVTVGYNPMPCDILTSMNQSDLCSTIVQMAKREQVTDIVVGFPLHKNGSIAEQTVLTVQFATILAQHAMSLLGPDVPVLLWDERYTSKEAAARAHSRNPNQALQGTLDAVAACIILEHYYHDQGQGAWRLHLPKAVQEQCELIFHKRQAYEEEQKRMAQEALERKLLERQQSFLRDRQQKQQAEQALGNMTIRLCNQRLGTIAIFSKR